MNCDLQFQSDPRQPRGNKQRGEYLLAKACIEVDVCQVQVSLGCCHPWHFDTSLVHSLIGRIRRKYWHYCLICSRPLPKGRIPCYIPSCRGHLLPRMSFQALLSVAIPWHSSASKDRVSGSSGFLRTPGQLKLFLHRSVDPITLDILAALTYRMMQ